jgi:type IV secretory pathway VirB10-like protein
VRPNLFSGRASPGPETTSEVSVPLRPAPPIAKRLNRNALTVAAVIMGMTVLTAIVVLNPGKVSRKTDPAFGGANDLPQIPARPAFLDEPLRRSNPAPSADTVAVGPLNPPSSIPPSPPASLSPSSPGAPETSNALGSEESSRATVESPRERAYRAALASSLVLGGAQAEPTARTVSDSGPVVTQEEQLVTLGDSIMRSALRQNSSASASIAGVSTNSEQSASPSNARASQQSFWEKAAETSRTTTTAQLVSAGSPYTLRAGTLIPALLITAINSDLPGDIVGQVSRDVFDSRSQRIPLIPKGSRLIGTYDNQVAAGQGRLLVAWTRLILPDGRSMHLPGLALTDTEGNSGAKGRVDNHWRRVFGNALMLSALSAGLQLSQPSQATVLSPPSPGQIAAGAVGQELSTVAIEILRRGMGAAPTITIPAGQAFNVLLNGDLVFDEPFVPRP